MGQEKKSLRIISFGLLLLLQQSVVMVSSFHFLSPPAVMTNRCLQPRPFFPLVPNIYQLAQTSDDDGAAADDNDDTLLPEKKQPSKIASAFGRQEYWDDLYRDNPKNEFFSWYTGWTDLEPFLAELIPSTNSTILLPGVGNDSMLRDMYDAGYQYLTAFDYAPQGMAQCRDMLGPERIIVRQDDDTSHNDSRGVRLFVGDARNLHELEDASFDVVLEKGTLDAIVQSGDGSSEAEKAVGLQSMHEAIAELTRVVRPGGLFVSISAICTERLEQSPVFGTSSDDKKWKVVQDGSLYVTEDGYASNNFDGTLLVWRKKQ